MNERLKEKEIQSLMDIKATIVELSNSILTISQGLWAVSTEVDSILMDETRFDVDMEHTTLPAEGKIIPPEPEVVRAKGRHQRITTPESIRTPQPLPEPLQTPTIAQTLPPPPLPPTPPERKPNVMERLLGKEQDEKTRQRKERMAQLEKELQELSKK